MNDSCYWGSKSEGGVMGGTRRVNSEQCSVTRQCSPPTYLQYNYFDFFVTPVVAGAGQGWGNIYKQTKVSHQQNFVCGPDTREVKWLQTSWLWDYLELTRDVWVVGGGGHTSPHSPPPPLCLSGHWAHIRWSEWVTSDPETIPDQRHVNTEHVIRQSRDSGE